MLAAPGYFTTTRLVNARLHLMSNLDRPLKPRSAVRFHVGTTDVTGHLVELNELFNLYWRRIIPLGQSSSIAFPFSRPDREPFWELVPQPGKTITPAIINNTSSVTYL